MWAALGGPATAGKPAPAPAIPGTIHFACATEPYFIGGEDLLYQMNADGSAKLRSSFIPSVNTFGNVLVSAKAYGTDQHRLWLVTETNPTFSQVNEVYVTRDGVNLTLVLSGSDVTDPDTGLRRVVYYGGPQWSNDGQDSFFSIIATCRVSDPVQRKLLSQENFICRCHLSGLDLDSLPADFEPLTESDPLVHPLISHRKPPELSGATPDLRSDARVSWSPDGSKVLVPFGAGGGPECLYSVDVNQVTDEPLVFTEVASLVFDNPYSGNSIDPEWSPASSSKIAFSSGKNTYTCAPDGTGLAVLATSAWAPRWSPDGKYIACTGSVEKGLQWPKVNILRIPSGGGTAVKLTSDLDANKSKWACRWTQ